MASSPRRQDDRLHENKHLHPSSDSAGIPSLDNNQVSYEGYREPAATDILRIRCVFGVFLLNRNSDQLQRALRLDILLASTRQLDVRAGSSLLDDRVCIPSDEVL